MEIIKFETNQSKNLYFNKTYIKPKKYSQNQEYQVVNIYPDITYQSFIGFGGAITESSAYCYSLLSDEKKKEFLHDYFVNINYSLCRLTIGSCDFSLSNYSYSNKSDLSDFSIEKDMKYIIPLIKDALAVNPNLCFLASPWSPPGFMKNTKIRTHGGKLLDKYKRTYAKYLAKYITSYKELGIRIDYITVQNEPNAVQRWESCIYTPEEEADFVCNYLFPEFEMQNIDTKILIYDQNKEKLFSRALAEFNTPTLKDKVSGIAFHWYTGNHFENINLCREVFSDKLLFHTEGCAGFNLNNPYAKEYAYDILNDLNSGINGYMDWNILLDSKGGPWHVKNPCNSPCMLNENNTDYIKTLAYYYIGHFSKFIKRGAKRIAFSKYSGDINITAFKNIDNSISVVILNNANYDIDFNLCMDDIMFKDKIEKESIISYLIK